MIFAFIFDYLLLFTAYIVVKSISKTEQIYHKQTLLCQCEVVIITDRSCGRFWRKSNTNFPFFVVFELMTNFFGNTNLEVEGWIVVVN